MAKSIKKMKKSLKKRFEHRIEKAKLKKKDDDILLERAEELLETDQEIATQILSMVKDPNNKISALGEFHESLDTDNIKDVVNTLSPEDKPLLFEKKEIVDEIKEMKTAESEKIIKEAICRTKNQSKKIDRLYDSVDMLGDYDVISILQTINDQRYENKKLAVVSKKIASNYLRFNMAMHIKELSECIETSVVRKQIPSKTSEEYIKLRKKTRAKNFETGEAVTVKIEKLLNEEKIRYDEGEIKKKKRDSKRNIPNDGSIR